MSEAESLRDVIRHNNDLDDETCGNTVKEILLLKKQSSAINAPFAKFN